MSRDVRNEEEEGKEEEKEKEEEESFPWWRSASLTSSLSSQTCHSPSSIAQHRHYFHLTHLSR